MMIDRRIGILATCAVAAISFGGLEAPRYHPSALLAEEARREVVLRTDLARSGPAYPQAAQRLAQRDDDPTARLRRLLAHSAPKQWFVAPHGRPGNPGTKDAPWDLEFALTNRTKIKPGDTLWLRVGTYRHPDRSPGSRGYVINLQGKPGKPVTVRAYRSERVTIDGGLHTSGFPYDDNRPEHLVIRDLEVIVSENLTQSRESAHSGSTPPEDLKRPWGGIELADGFDIKLINNVVHGNMQGIGLWARVQGDSELYGNLIYDNGWLAPDRGHGHGVYLQNEPTSYKYLRNNIVFGHYGMNVHAYGSKSASVEKLVITNNIFFNAVDRPNSRVLVGGLNRASNKHFRITDNVLFHSNLQVGYGGRPVHDAVVTGNAVVMATIEAPRLVNAVLQSNFVWEELYLSNRGGWTGSLKPGPKDNAQVPNEPIVAFHANAYDDSRAHVALLCFRDRTEIDLDVSQFMSPGDKFELKRPDDFYGDAVYRGECSGPVVKIPVTGMFTVYVIVITDADRD